MRIFYSGDENKGTPEKVLGKRAHVMFTYFEMQKSPHKRMRAIIAYRKKHPRKKSCP